MYFQEFLSLNQLSSTDREKAQVRFGNANNELLSTDRPMCKGLSTFIGFCQDFSKPKFPYKACSDEVGTADIVEAENATLKRQGP